MIRQAARDDAATVTAIIFGSRRNAGPLIPSEVHTDEENLAFVAGVLLGERDTWLAIADDGSAVGVLTLDGDDLDQLYVAPESQGTGVGSLLVEHAKALRPDGLELWVFASNVPAQRFYERHGFVAIARTEGADNEEHAPDIRYRWTGHGH